jgi:hypothetical protein
VLAREAKAVIFVDSFHIHRVHTKHWDVVWAMRSRQKLYTEGCTRPSLERVMLWVGLLEI